MTHVHDEERDQGQARGPVHIPRATQTPPGTPRPAPASHPGAACTAESRRVAARCEPTGWSPKIGQIRFRGPVGGTGAAPATTHRAGRPRGVPGRPAGGLSAPTAAHRDTSKPPRVGALKLVPCPITGQTVLQQPCGLPGGF